MRPLATLALLATLAVTGCGGGSSSKKKTTPATTSTAAAAPQTTSAGCTKVAEPKPKGAQHLAKPKQTLNPSKRWVLKLDTNCGEIDILLDVKRAPKTTSSVASLVRRGFYDGLAFHRVAADFVLHGGDPVGNGQGDADYGVLEKPPADTKYSRRVV